ncbi:MAG TPA: efflux RND transporter periplasmic adaptor subunit [Allosphingosinicella sp.]|jgi:RND family efflux transporter MFP subunit
MNMFTKVDRAAVEIADAPPAPAPRRRWTRAGLTLVSVAVLGFAGTKLVEQDSPAVAAPPPPTVTVAAPLVRDVAEWDEYVGRFEASRSVEVRPRISGPVTGIHFADGAYVRQGQLLFTIDARPYQAALAEARAAVAGARSDLALAEADLSRALRLLEVEAVSRSDVDRLRARVQASNAALAAAQARVQARALDVEFTQVRAPISGRISDHRVDAGNLVSGGGAGEATLLTTINAVDQMHFAFDASESLFLKTKRARESGASGAPVEIRLQDETGYRWRGRLDFTDNGLDPRSGTIRGRAVVANPGRFLTPGMFGNMRLASGATRPAMLVPDAAIQTDQARKLILVVGPGGAVAPKPVELGPTIEGLRVIRAGLKPTDQVVISGMQLAAPGAKVMTKRGAIAPQPGADAPPPVAAAAAGDATFSAR